MLHFTLFTPGSTLYILRPNSPLHPRSTLRTPQPARYTLHSTLWPPNFPLYTPRKIYTPHHPHSTLQSSDSTSFTKFSKLYTAHSTLYTPRSSTPTPLHIPHLTLYSFQSPHTLQSRMPTLHSPPHTLHSARCTLHSALHTTLYSPHSTLYTPGSSTLHT